MMPAVLFVEDTHRRRLARQFHGEQTVDGCSPASAASAASRRWSVHRFARGSRFTLHARMRSAKACAPLRKGCTDMTRWARLSRLWARPSSEGVRSSSEGMHRYDTLGSPIPLMARGIRLERPPRADSQCEHAVGHGLVPRNPTTSCSRSTLPDARKTTDSFAPRSRQTWSSRAH
jgi:hypothetical protein